MFTHAKRMTLVVAMALMVPVASLGVVSSPAVAAPGGVFAVFAHCPLAAFRALGIPPGAAKCGFHQLTSGELVIGSMDVPIDRTITLQGGFIKDNPEDGNEYLAYPAEGAESLSKTELAVPGGLSGLVDCGEIKGWGSRERYEQYACRALSFFDGTNGVTATIESAASATNPLIYNEYNTIEEEGTAVTFPVRVHLKNPFLGASCYIGSEASPLQLHLTTGATSPPEGFKSIHGALGQVETLEEDGLLTVRTTGDSLVDNTFSAPVAEGCGESFSSIIDPILDSMVKLPSPAGHNTVILTGEARLATAEHVETDEKYQAEVEAKKQQEEVEAKKKQEEEAKKRQEELEAKRTHRKHWGHWPRRQAVHGQAHHGHW